MGENKEHREEKSEEEIEKETIEKVCEKFSITHDVKDCHYAIVQSLSGELIEGQSGIIQYGHKEINKLEDLEEVIIGICEKSANRAKLKSKWSGKKSNDPTLRNGFKEYNEEPKPGFTLEYLDDKSAERGGAYEQSFSATMNGLKEALKVSDELAKKENASRVKLRPSYMLDLLQNEYVKPLYYYSEDEE